MPAVSLRSHFSSLLASRVNCSSFFSCTFFSSLRGLSLSLFLLKKTRHSPWTIYIEEDEEKKKNREKKKQLHILCSQIVHGYLLMQSKTVRLYSSEMTRGRRKKKKQNTHTSRERGRAKVSIHPSHTRNSCQ